MGPANVGRPRHARRGKKLLIAEGDDANRRLLRWALISAGYHAIDEVANPSELAARLRRGVADYDLLIVDANLASASQLATADAPLILMTASLCGNICATVREAGARACVHRPIYVDELRGAVRRSLQPPATGALIVHPPSCHPANAAA